MAEDIFKKLIPTQSITYEPIGKCIYCGSVKELTKEHIVPKALNGTMILPKSSCLKCCDITKKFEQTVTRSMYGIHRIKRGYKTRRPKERPTSYSISYSDSDGAIRAINLDMSQYPDIYLVVNLPPPGILNGAPLTELNPEMQISLVGNPNEIARAISSIGNENISLILSHSFPWGDFCRVLAKIAHGFLVACVGQAGYIPLLPDLILGRSSYLAHYIGGIEGGSPIHMMSHNLQLILIPDLGTGAIDTGYIAVYIQLLGGVSMPTYQVIAAKISDFDLIIEKINSMKG